MPGPVQLFNTDPNVQAQAALIQQRQALAQAMLQQGMQPVDTSNRSIGGIGYRISPMEGLAKILQAYAGNKGMQQGAQDQAALAGQAYGALLSRLQPQSPPSFDPSQVSQAQQGALSTGAAAGSVGPTNDNAARLALALKAAQPANPGTPPNPMNPTNAPADLLAGVQAGFIPEKLGELMMKPYTATAATQAAVQGGMPIATANQAQFAKDTTDPKILAMQQAGFSPDLIKAAMMGETAKAAEIERKPGQQFVNPMLGASGMVPKLPDYANPVGAIAPNGAVPAVSLIPGAVQASARVAGADQGAKSANTIMQIPGPGGSTLTGWGGQFAGAGSGPVAPSAGGIPAAPDAGAGRGFAQQPIARPVVPGAPPGFSGTVGQSTSDAQVNKTGGDVVAALPQAVQQSAQVRRSLENALSYLSDTKSGPGTAPFFKITAMLQNLGLPVANKPTEDFQTLSKFLANGLSNAAAINGNTGSDARMDQFSHGQPNVDTMNKEPLDKAIRYVLSQNDAVPAANQVIGQAYQRLQAQGDPRAAYNAQQEWLKQYDPKVFEFGRMSPADQAAFKAQMQRDNPKAAAAFGDKYNAAHAAGWVQ
jgi:hypothetical protein